MNLREKTNHENGKKTTMKTMKSCSKIDERPDNYPTLSENCDRVNNLMFSSSLYITYTRYT